MHLPKRIGDEVNAAVGVLVELSLSVDQNFSLLRQLRDGFSEVTYPGAQYLSVILGGGRYVEGYAQLARRRSYNVRMLDGALLQLMYRFSGEVLEQHRLAFFPAPHLEDFQNSADVYLEDEMYAEIVAREITPIPLRFDYDCREGVPREGEHPKAHMTLGQYQSCRIPVSAPLSPLLFVDFILRNFYHTDVHRFADELPRTRAVFDDSILASEEAMVHVRIPGARVRAAATRTRAHGKETGRR